MIAVKPIHKKAQTQEMQKPGKTTRAKLTAIYLSLAALMVVFIIMSLCYGGYRFDFFLVAQIVWARLIDVAIWASGVPAGVFSPYAHVFPPVTDSLQECFVGLSTLLQPVPQTWPEWINIMIWEVRFPRELLVILVGAGLAVSGATFQGTFRNPLVSENILGVSSGAGFGAALGILIFNNNALLVQALAFSFGLLTVIITFMIGRVYKSNSTIVLVLSGIIIGSAFSAGTSMMKYVADPLSNQLSAIVFWLMGSFGQASYGTVLSTGPVIILGIVVLLMVRWRLNVLSLGDDEARTLGVDIGRFRAIVILCATMITAAAVSVCGAISWIGLIIPHMGRMLVGPDHRTLLPMTIAMGATYMLIVDTLCLSLTTAVIPTNIITSIIGVPFFLYLLKKSKDTWA